MSLLRLLNGRVCTTMVLDVNFEARGKGKRVPLSSSNGWSMGDDDVQAILVSHHTTNNLWREREREWVLQERPGKKDNILCIEKLQSKSIHRDREEEPTT